MLEPRADQSMVLADGRTIAFTEWGDEDGRAVLFFHGSPHSRLWCPDVVATTRAGVRLIVIDRPGYGRSDPPPAEMAIVDWTEDVVQLAEALRLDRFGVVGWSGGALYAAACAAAIPDRLTGAGEVAGAGWPVDEQPGVLEGLSDASRRVHVLARTDRRAAARLAEEFASEWVPQLRARPEDIMDGSEPIQDLRHFDDSAWAENFFAAVRESLQAGPRCCAWDSVAQLGAWGFALEDLTIDFHLGHGAHDPEEPMASVEYWASRMPRSHVTVWEDSGHFAIVDHWAEVLGWFVSAA